MNQKVILRYQIENIYQLLYKCFGDGGMQKGSKDI